MTKEEYAKFLADARKQRSREAVPVKTTELQIFAIGIAEVAADAALRERQRKAGSSKKSQSATHKRWRTLLPIFFGLPKRLQDHPRSSDTLDELDRLMKKAGVSTAVSTIKSDLLRFGIRSAR